ncbi:MFS transporter [Alicyclobacillus dauci]|uniref:MFS transporter n=1 Tax=Alicyclobacillus dauci TaxID=1475485 RepID=A0ABY6YYR5_9BACL|nr:MFS transporter [Alicyclobacillus dauci]WAH35716.1 MFS transporter [Alicyclobacillus dauci]
MINTERGFNYRTMWLILMMGWMVSAADRSISGPVITWMIQHKVAFLLTAAHPFAVGGLIGSVLFTGYMLNQFPGGYLGDRFGHRKIIAIGVILGGIGTLASGLLATLLGFVALRVVTGLGDGMLYANDRTLIAEVSPFEKRGLGMGVVISGFSVGITLETLLAPYMINWGSTLFGTTQGWRMPFYLIGICTLILGAVMAKYFNRTTPAHTKQASYGTASIAVGKYAITFLIAIMVIFFVADRVGLPSWGVATIELVFALVLICFAFLNKGRELGTILKNKDLMLLNLAAVAVLWNLWFFTFWSVSIISDGAHTTFLKAALTAAFNGVAGLLGYPVGGWLSDYAVSKNWGRKPFLVSFTFMQGILTLVFAIYLMHHGSSLVVMGILLFVTSLFFNFMQPIQHAMVSDFASSAQRGSAFGMFNLFGEMGAVISPALGGTLRDATGNWNSAVLVDAIVILISVGLMLFVNQKRAMAKVDEHPISTEVTV